MRFIIPAIWISLFIAFMVGGFILTLNWVFRGIDGPAEDRRFLWYGIAVGALTLVTTIAVIMWQVTLETESGPCLREETRMQYNPATKTVMPYNYCAERGEWIG